MNLSYWVVHHPSLLIAGGSGTCCCVCFVRGDHVIFAFNAALASFLIDVKDRWHPSVAVFCLQTRLFRYIFTCACMRVKLRYSAALWCL